MATMQCDVVSVKESIYSGQVTMLIAKGAGGELGILPGHAPLVTLLQPGPIRVQLENGTEEIVYVSGGVLEVQPHVVTVLQILQSVQTTWMKLQLWKLVNKLNNC